MLLLLMCVCYDVLLFTVSEWFSIDIVCSCAVLLLLVIVCG